MPKDTFAREQEMVVQVACHALTRTIEQYSPVGTDTLPIAAVRHQPNVRRFDQQPLECPRDRRYCQPTDRTMRLSVFRRANLTPEPGDRRPKLTP